ncbi:hypothetical protein [Rhizobium sp. G21]|uniref:hypothetical protein n=1 Tax=Rhizobium sp. G21 TaxID=2758439 RepID=UPI001603EA75|nr:hypothetical protein [Rhizobium sp. G21]MBB1250383.1 hypothetical protein [Rhizobium sp. G21]
MKLHVAGEKSKALCPHCQELTGATYAYRDVPFDDGVGRAKNILALVCDQCGDIVATPAQSTPAIKAARETATRPIEVNIPAPFIEALDLAAFRIDPEATSEFRKKLLAYYIFQAAETDQAQTELIGVAPDRPAFNSEAPKRRLSLKVTPRLNAAIERLMTTLHLTKSDLVKLLVLKIYDDILGSRNPANLKELQRLAAVATA